MIERIETFPGRALQALVGWAYAENWGGQTKKRAG